MGRREIPTSVIRLANPKPRRSESGFTERPTLFLADRRLRVARRGLRMSMENVILYVAIVWTCLVRRAASVDRPNIVIVLADDLGWNDVSFHGSNQIPTPNIDALAYNGIILNSHYVPALCTPSRASLLTGKYPTSMGMQHLVILAPEPWGLPLEETLMPQLLKRHGYATHAVGKWHLGFHKKEYTPTYRGFDSHFGYWNGFQDYYDHTMQSESLKGYDMRRGLEVDHASKGVYSTDVFTNEAVSIIENHNSTRGPLFLYLAHLAPHAGNPDEPFQAPEEEIAKHSRIADPERRIYAAMVTKVDESLGRIVTAMRDKNMLDNSVILFMSDNGAVTFGMHSNRGSNYPLRGLKESPWEGGVRGVAAIWSPLLNKTQRVSKQLMHVSDWLPTFYAAAGLDASELGAIDGTDMWETLSNDLESPRTEVFNNYDEVEDYSSLRIDSWKYVAGTAQGGEVDLWYGETGEDGSLDYNVTGVLLSPTNRILGEFSKGVQGSQVLRLRRDSVLACSYPTLSPFISDNHNETDVARPLVGGKEEIVRELETYLEYPLGGVLQPSLTPPDRANLERVIESGELKNAFKCNPLKEVCLFNLEKDPCERVNLRTIFPSLVQTMEARLKELKKSVVRPLNQPDDPFSDPALHNGTWANWCDVRSEKDPRVVMKIMMESGSALSLDRLILLVENVSAAFPASREIFLRLAELTDKFAWAVTLMVFAVTVLYAVASLRRMVGSESCDPARKKSWSGWENLTFRSLTDPTRSNARMCR